VAWARTGGTGKLLLLLLLLLLSLPPAPVKIAIFQIPVSEGKREARSNLI